MHHVHAHIASGLFWIVLAIAVLLVARDRGGQQP